MVKTALRGYAMDVVTANATEINSYLSDHSAPTDWRISTKLDSMPLIGCAALTWQSHPVTLICYGDGPEPNLWLFIVESSSLPDPPDDAGGITAEINRLHTVSWSNAGKTYLLAGNANAPQLLELMKERL